jgi:hypothetical protein
MTEHATLAYYAAHSALTDPGVHAGSVNSLPSDVLTLCQTLQGMLIHEAWIDKYGVSPAVFSGQSRETLSVAQRLEQLLAIDPSPLTTARPDASKALSTCRDFSLMLCGVLRHHGVPARVRCGFAQYFAANPYEDHWVCQYWASGEQRWVLVDAQLDQLQRYHLKVDFEPTDVPRAAFTTGVDAWRLCRDRVIDAEQLGHGTVTGLFFARVNLARDLLALAKIETSAWDTWRVACEPGRALDDKALYLCDSLAAAGELSATELAPSLCCPPWQTAVTQR